MIENDGQSEYVPAVYMLLELAGAGDLFDKIGECSIPCTQRLYSPLLVAPDYGVDDDLAHNYFRQLIEALVSQISFKHGDGDTYRSPISIALRTWHWGLSSGSKAREYPPRLPGSTQIVGLWAMLCLQA